MSRPRELVTCSLCGSIWTAPKGLGASSYERHYLERHHIDLQAERSSA